MEQYTFSLLINEIVKTKGINVLRNSSVFCGMIDDLAPYLSVERKIMHRALTPAASEKLLEIYEAKGNKESLLLKLHAYLLSELGLSQEWSNTFISGFSEAFGWDWSYPNEQGNTSDGTLKENGECSFWIDRLSKEQIRIMSKTISAGAFHVLAVREDGKVIAIGDNRAGQCNVSSWENIIGLAAGVFHSVGLKNDGTVCSTKISPESSKFDVGQCNVSSWENIVDIGAGDAHTVGLKADGTVVAVGSNRVGQCEVNDWRDIISISVKGAVTLGLKANGTVVSTGKKAYETQSWRDVFYISAGGTQKAGLIEGGQVLISNYLGERYHGQCDVDIFHNVCMISTNAYNTVGLKSDGTVISTAYIGEPEFDRGQCNVSEWKDIVSISAGGSLTVGIKKNGGLIAVGNNNYGQCNVTGCRLFNDVNIYLEKIQHQRDGVFRQFEEMKAAENSRRQELIKEKEILTTELQSLNKFFNARRISEIKDRLQKIEKALEK